MTQNLPPANTICGRCGCIIFYTGNDCIFCPDAAETLKSVAEELDTSETAYCVIDVDDARGLVVEAPMNHLPTIRICDRTITGIPDRDSIRDALLRLHSLSCYYESRQSRFE